MARPLESVPLSPIHRVTAAAADGPSQIVVVSADPPAVFAVDLVSAAIRQLESVPQLPPCVGSLPGTPCQPGAVANSPSPDGVAVDPHGVVYVSDAAQASVFRIAGGSISQWYSDVHLVSVEHTGPAGLAFDSLGDLLVTVTTALTDADQGSVWRIGVDQSGAAVSPTEVVKTSNNAAPSAVTSGPSGHLYVSLAAANAVGVYDATGSEVAHLPSSGPAPVTPRAIALDGTTLLVGTAAGWGVSAGVVRIGTGEPGSRP